MGGHVEIIAVVRGLARSLSVCLKGLFDVFVDFGVLVHFTFRLGAIGEVCGCGLFLFFHWEMVGKGWIFIMFFFIL